MSATQSWFGAGRPEVAFDEVLGRHARRERGSSSGRACLGDQAGDAGLAHQPLDALSADPFAARQTQLGMDPRSAIDPRLRGVDLADLPEQPRVVELAI